MRQLLLKNIHNRCIHDGLATAAVVEPLVFDLAVVDCIRLCGGVDDSYGP
jgi:hypothetical protein